MDASLPANVITAILWAVGLHDGFCPSPFPTEGPAGVPEEVGALAARAPAHAEGQQHEAPAGAHQQPEQRGHSGEQRVLRHLPGLLQLSLRHPPSQVGETLPGGAGKGGTAALKQSPLALPPLPQPIRQANGQCLRDADTFSLRRSSC